MNIMKKRLLYTAVVFITILCSACSNQTASVEENKLTENNSITDTEDIQEPTVIMPEADEDSVSAQITFITKEDNESAEDGKLLYTSRCVYPVVAIEGNENAADKINADIQARVDTFLADTSTREFAKEDYQFYLSNEEINSEYGFSGGYYDDFDTVATRNDSNVISFLITISYYSGGAHGGYYSMGLNFNAKTGDPIAFSELSENTKKFQTDTLAYLKELAATNTYRSIMWEDESVSKEESDLEQVLFHNEKWYLCTYGLVFFSYPYELGAFYAGEIAFTIPYSDLEEMGLLEEYSYHENLTIKLQTEEICSFDLNGDGAEEEIQFYIDEPGMGDTDVHFFLNGIDYASEHEELSSQLSDDCWAQCFLYDMDTEDNTIEIAFQINHYTYIYRYQKNGLFTYLGKIEGTVTDPGFSPEKLLIQ